MTVSTAYSQDNMSEFIRNGHWEAGALWQSWDANARQWPDEEAIADSRFRLTWAQAREWTDRVALGLTEQGIKKDEAVVIQLPNWVEYYLLRVACQKAGINCLPVQRTFRHKEMEYILKYLDAAGVVIPWQFEDRDFYRMVNDIRPNLPHLRHVFVARDPAPDGATSIQQMAQRPTRSQDIGQPLQGRAHGVTDIMLGITSGSTGTPKVVEQPMGGWLGYMRAYVRHLAITRKDIAAGLSPVGAGVNAMPFFVATMVGIKLALLETFDAEDALRLIERERITYAAMVPAMLAMIVSHSNISKYDVSSLRVIQCGGAPLSYTVAAEAEKKLKCTILQTFGASDFGAGFIPPRDAPLETRLLTVGRPVGATQFRIVDETGQPVRPGDVGELQGQGPYCATGYYKDPNSTRQAWVGGWYSFGDLARVNHDGNIVIVGRKKDMIIRGGQNIYPVEVENILFTHPKVQDVAIVAMPDPVLGERACAYVAPKPGQGFSFEEMRLFLRQKQIASFKMPERLEIVDRLPLLPDVQKVDKKVLREDIAAKLQAEGGPQNR